MVKSFFIRDNMRQLMLILFTIAYTGVYAQIAKINWQDEICEFEGTFDSTKVTRTQINNCFRLTKGFEFMLMNSPMVFQPSDLLKIDTNNYTKNMKTK